MKFRLGWLVMILGCVCAWYVGGWLMFIKPIIITCQHFDAGTLTGMIVGSTVLKCIFATPISTIIGYISVMIARVLFDL